MPERSALALAAEVRATKGTRAAQFLVDEIQAAIRRGDDKAADHAHRALTIIMAAKVTALI